MFGTATITLGIGPHSSFVFVFVFVTNSKVTRLCTTSPVKLGTDYPCSRAADTTREHG